MVVGLFGAPCVPPFWLTSGDLGVDGGGYAVVVGCLDWWVAV